MASWSMIVGEPGLGKTRLIEEFLTEPVSIRRTPGSSGAARSCCRTHPCIRLPNGVVSDLGGPIYQPSGGSPNLKAHWRR